MSFYRRSLFSPRRFSSAESKDLQCSVLPKTSSLKSGVNHLADGAEAMVDSFSYLLSGSMTSRRLQEILDKVRYPEVRLCLRAHGQMQPLLRCLQQEVEEKESRLLRLGCWHCLSLDASHTSAELLDACWQFLTKTFELEKMEKEAPKLRRQDEASTGVAVGGNNSLKRRRVQVKVTQEEISANLAQILEDPQMEGSDERSLSLQILSRCLGNLTPEVQPKAIAQLWTWFPEVLMRQPSPLLWEAFERLARQGAPSGTVGNPSILAAARVCLMDETRSGSGQAESCLKALHSLVAYGHDSLTSLFTSELLELLVSRCANLGVVGPTVRTVLGILGNLASRSEEFCKELSRSPKAEPFAKSLAKSLVWYKDQVSQESTLEVEVHLNYAMASLVMGWLAWGSSEAQQHLEDQLGSTQVLLDILRTFTVFQDRCGTLTDNSLLCVASVMRFLEANGPKSLEVSDVSDKMELKPRPLPRPSTSEVASEPHHQKLRTNCSDGLLDLTPPRPRKEVILKPRESSPNVWTKNVYRPSSGTPDATFGPSMQVYQRRK